MLYTMLIYGEEGVFERLPEKRQEEILATHQAIQEEVSASGHLGPVVRLMPTASAVTLRDGADSTLVLDGPYAETKEHLLGIYLFECASIEEAIAIARKFPTDAATYEIRPVAWSNQNTDEEECSGTS